MQAQASGKFTTLCLLREKFLTTLLQEGREQISSPRVQTFVKQLDLWKTEVEPALLEEITAAQWEKRAGGVSAALMCASFLFDSRLALWVGALGVTFAGMHFLYRKSSNSAAALHHSKLAFKSL